MPTASQWHKRDFDSDGTCLQVSLATGWNAEAHCESKLAAEILAEEAWFCVCTLKNEQSRHMVVCFFLAMVNLLFR